MRPVTDEVALPDGGTRDTSTLRALLTGRMLTSVAVTVVVGAGLLTFAANSGGTLTDPVGYRAWEIGITLAALALFVVGGRQSIKSRKFSPIFLTTVASASAFWQETYGDWGAYLLYSDRFLTYEWGQGPLTSPVQAWWFIPGYVMFYATLFTGMATQVTYVRSRWPKANPYLVATLLAFPVFYVFDLIVEGTATGLGLWHYTYIFGPSVTIGNAAFPLVWPIVEQVPFVILVAVAMMWRSHRGEDVFQVAARGVRRRDPGQLAILVSWVVILNMAFLVTTIGPGMLMRAVAGPASGLVP